MLCGLVIGLINGLLFTKLDLPHPFVSTLGTQLVIRGFCLWITGSASMSGFPDGVMWLGYQNIAGFPICFILVIVVAIVASIFPEQNGIRTLYLFHRRKQRSGASVRYQGETAVKPDIHLIRSSRSTCRHRDDRTCQPCISECR